MSKIKVGLKPPYNIITGKNSVYNLTKYITDYNIGNYGIVLTNKTLYSLAKKKIPKIFKKSKRIKFKFMVLPDSERIKSFTYLLKVFRQIKNLDFTRQTFFICWGGGVIGDLGGFAASIYKRGVPYIQIPTTLLAQIDASIGGKTAIDLETGKNLVGSFWQPSLVISDPAFLETLKKAQIQEGLAEAIKYGLIKDAELFHFIEKNSDKLLAGNEKPLRNIVEKCVRIKAKIVEKDEREEEGIRTILNFGHTVGHGIEASSNYRISHGKAVAAGMLAALHISKNSRVLTDKKLIPRTEHLLENIGLPTRLKIDIPKALLAIKKDKKFIRGKTKVVLLKNCGKTVVTEKIKFPQIAKGINYITT